MLPMTALLRPARPAAAVLGVLLLAACSGGGDDAADPTPSGTPTSTATQDAGDGGDGSDGNTASPDAVLTLQEACTAMYVDGDEPLERRVVAALVDVSEGADTESVSAMTAVGIELGSCLPTCRTS
ncbi:hypothetical protein [Cellulosimicrobium sp. CUA-896]|uniref:hypothetical protein n=1 Tax=Cellulosimicrobium sp. CUA-896 TaxID=1517881 RepID=UPI000962B36B|nr:hypothetical protein [Cellulosimicrobium sp. CUA-896]OLT50981.1 hypothetical protein BJF88_02495 [Cellulosimicrobium sp. CUA-896]